MEEIGEVFEAPCSHRSEELSLMANSGRADESHEGRTSGMTTMAASRAAIERSSGAVISGE